MKKGQKVSWLVNTAMPNKRGWGEVLSEEDNGHVFVAVDTLAGEQNPGYHPVIYCAVTWLTAAEAVPAPGTGGKLEE